MCLQRSFMVIDVSAKRGIIIAPATFKDIVRGGSKAAGMFFGCHERCGQNCQCNKSV